MKSTTKNTTSLLEPNWELRASRQARARLLLKFFPDSEWKTTDSPDNRSVRWAISELEANGVSGDDFVALERGEGGAGLKIIKDGGGRFTLRASGGAGRYLISAKWIDWEETVKMAETYNSGRSDWMYSSKWEEGSHSEPVEDALPVESAGDGDRAAVLSVAFLPTVGICGIMLGGGAAGGVLGILGLTAVAVAITACPILAKRVMSRIDGREVQDDTGGLVRIS